MKYSTVCIRDLDDTYLVMVLWSIVQCVSGIWTSLTWLLSYEVIVSSYVSGIWISLTWLWWFGFRLEPILGNEKASQKIVAQVKKRVAKSGTEIIFSFIMTQHQDTQFITWYLRVGKSSCYFLLPSLNPWFCIFVF